MEEKNNAEFIKQFKEVLALHDRTLRYLESNRIDGTLLKNYKKLQSYLLNISEDDICKILEAKPKRLPSKEIISINELEDHEIEQLTAEQVKEEILKDKASRKYLERIAIIRFGVTKGGASSIPNKEALLEKLQTLISNEQTHETIARLASDFKER